MTLSYTQYFYSFRKYQVNIKTGLRITVSTNNKVIDLKRFIKEREYYQLKIMAGLPHTLYEYTSFHLYKETRLTPLLHLT